MILYYFSFVTLCWAKEKPLKCCSKAIGSAMCMHKYNPIKVTDFIYWLVWLSNFTFNCLCKINSFILKTFIYRRSANAPILQAFFYYYYYHKLPFLFTNYCCLNTDRKICSAKLLPRVLHVIVTLQPFGLERNFKQFLKERRRVLWRCTVRQSNHR